MDKVQPITRRAALIGALVSSAAVAVPVSALSARIEGPGICELIAEHRQIMDALSPLLDAQAEAEARYRKTLSPLVPLTITPTGRRVSGSLELRLFGREHVAAEIRKTHASLIELHCTRFREEMAPAATAEMRASLKKSQARCMRALSAAVKEEASLKQSSGYANAWARARDVSRAEVEASRAIYAYVPRNAGEAKAKSEWIVANLDERGADVPDGHEWQALLDAVGRAVLA